MDYLEPLIYCRNPRQSEGRPRIPECEPIVLPYSGIPSSENGDEDDYAFWRIRPWPLGEWKANIGCPSCGLVAVYTSDHIHWDRTWYDAPGVIYSDATCVSVQFRCSRKDCASVIKFFTTIDERTTACREKLLDKLCQGFFSGLCSQGDRFFALSRNQYLIDDQIEAIEADGSLVYNTVPPVWLK
jgi:hypothetical protein